jgi:hypothetical protein
MPEFYGKLKVHLGLKIPMEGCRVWLKQVQGIKFKPPIPPKKKEFQCTPIGRLEYHLLTFL